MVRDAAGAVTSEEYYAHTARNAARSTPAAGMLGQVTLENLTLVTDGDGDVIERYVYGGQVDQVLAGQVNGQVQWYLSDQQNSVQAVVATDAADTASVVKRLDYSGFGEQISDSALSVPTRFTYTGRDTHLPSR